MTTLAAANKFLTKSPEKFKIDEDQILRFEKYILSLKRLESSRWLGFELKASERVKIKQAILEAQEWLAEVYKKYGA